MPNDHYKQRREVLFVRLHPGTSYLRYDLALQHQEFFVKIRSISYFLISPYSSTQPLVQYRRFWPPRKESCCLTNWKKFNKYLSSEEQIIILVRSAPFSSIFQ